MLDDAPDEAPFGPQPFPAAPPDIVVRGALALIRGLKRLTDLVTPPELAIFDRTIGSARTQLLGAAARWRIPDALAEGPMDSAALARRLGLDEDALHRVMRALVHDGVFARRADGRWENNRLSAALRSGTTARTRQWALYWASRSNLAAWEALDHALRTGGGAFREANGKSVWAWFAEHPDEERCFAEAMTGLTVAAAPFVATTYPFGEVKTVCDVGGGRGTLLSEILVRNPGVEGVLCDAAGLEPLARKLFAQRGVAARARFEVGNFFESVPGGAEVYVLKNILHDWGDASCKTILGAVRRAMAPGARVLLVESLLARDDTASVAAFADLQMMIACDEGRERSREEFAALLDATGFRLGRVWPTATDSLVEGVAV